MKARIALNLTLLFLAIFLVIGEAFHGSLNYTRTFMYACIILVSGARVFYCVRKIGSGSMNLK